jgi:hypothetical protein
MPPSLGSRLGLSKLPNPYRGPSLLVDGLSDQIEDKSLANWNY